MHDERVIASVDVCAELLKAMSESNNSANNANNNGKSHHSPESFEAFIPLGNLHDDTDSSLPSDPANQDWQYIVDFAERLRVNGSEDNNSSTAHTNGHANGATAGSMNCQDSEQAPNPFDSARPEPSDPNVMNPPGSTSNSEEILVTLEADDMNQLNPDVLVALIQELNECNSALLNRVSQLEQEVEQSRQSHDAKGREASTPEIQDAIARVESENLQLLHQLESSNQGHQRQQILIDTLNSQLQENQERIAQLERECTLTQQRYHEQTQRLAEAETTCRDLRNRLHRQQRYTLQFKAALEKALEVSDLGAAAIADPEPKADVPSFPKAKKIQPWSAAQKGSASDPIMPKAVPVLPLTSQDSGVEESSQRSVSGLELPDPRAVESLKADPAKPKGDRPTHLTPISYDLKSDVPSWWTKFKPSASSPESISSDPNTNLIDESDNVDHRDSNPAAIAPSPESTDTLHLDVSAPTLPTLSDSAASETELNPELLEQLDAAVQPLIDAVVSAMKSGEMDHATLQSLQQTSASLEADQSQLGMSLLPDLAKLMDLATQETLQTSASDDASAVVSPHPSPDPTTVPSASSASQSESASAGDRAEMVPSESESVLEEPAEDPINGPAPVVYPDRRKRKLRSLAAVDLPMFPQST